MPTPQKPVAATKRKSTLSELGIKPGVGGEPTKSPTPKTPTSPSTTMTRKNSVNTSPSISRTQSGTTTKKGPPKLDRTTSNSSVNSPTSTTPRRRSIVPTTSTNQRASTSPLVRKSSVNVTNSVSSKRVTSPGGLVSVTEVQLTEKDQEIKRLKTIESESASKITALEIELEKIREELKLALETSKEVIVDNKEIDDSMKELLIQETEDKLKETENKLQERHKSEMENLLDQQDKKLEAELAILKIDLSAQYDEELRTVKIEHENQLQQLKSEYNDQIHRIQKEQEALNSEKDSTISDLKEQLKSLQETQLVKIQAELDSTLTTLNNLKQEKENLEYRHREEIKQLQTGSDNGWLEKIKSAEQEVDNLRDNLQQKNEEHQKALQLLQEAHTKELKQLQASYEERESQMETKIQELKHQLEKPPAANDNTTTTDHQECLNKLEAKQNEINQLKARVHIPQGDDRLIHVAEQHRAELKKMHVQYQKVVDAKNRELEDYAYRVKAIVAAKQKEMEKLELTIETLEAKVEDCKKEGNRMKERVAHWEMLAHNNEAIIMDMKRECLAHKDEIASLQRR